MYETNRIEEGSMYQVNRAFFFPYSIVKRSIDIFVSLIGIIVLYPIVLLFALFIVIESPGSPFFYQERLGLHGKTFTLLKLRSMRLDAEKDGMRWAAKNDRRITKVGLFIRKTRIDEVPQLWNVLKGEMSLIGPRPERPYFYNEFEKSIPGFRNRLAVKPGLTGWAQVNGGYELGPEEKLKFDMFYINYGTLYLDIRIIMKTIKVVFTGEGAR